MTQSKPNAGLDEVLAGYSHAAPEFDAKVLQSFVNEHPKHAAALRRYAQMQLTSVRATIDEIEQEEVRDDELLPLQSRVLREMQILRGVRSSDEVDGATKKLASISGMAATRAATNAIFGTWAHGEDTLVLCVLEPAPGVDGVPEWFFARLGSHIQVAPSTLQACVGARRHGAKFQRYSTTTRPQESTPISWEEAVRQCIDDEVVQRTILESPGPPLLPVGR